MLLCVVAKTPALCHPQGKNAKEPLLPFRSETKIVSFRKFKDQKYKYRIYFLLLEGKKRLEFLGNYDNNLFTLSYSALSNKYLLSTY